MTIFTAQEVRKTFTNGEVAEEILKGIALALHTGEITAFVGTSGSGKSTLLTIAAGLQSATDGQIIFGVKNLTDMNPEQIRQIRASEFGFTFQSAHLVPFLTAQEQLLLMLEISGTKLTKYQQKKKLANY